MSVLANRAIDCETATGADLCPSPPRAAKDATLLSRLGCPSCRADESLVLEQDALLTCAACSMKFPRFRCGKATIPWLFPQPYAAKLEWTERFRGFRHTHVVEHNRLNRALDKTLASDIGKKRIEDTMRAKREYCEQVETLLAPFGLVEEVMVPGMTKALHERLPRKQLLTSYAANVFRDWAWDNGENDSLFHAVKEVLSADRRGSPGSVLTLGAGASRLSYDIHRCLSPSLSVALDINPLLLRIASRVIHGDDVSLYEFPTAALDASAAGVRQTCRAPAALCGGPDAHFRFVLGDATRPPFREASFDTVVTPWLIDILSHDLGDFVAEVNRLLPQGGVWLNTGTLAFFDRDPRRCYSEGEVFEIIEKHGFDLVAVDHRTVPYLQSPHSAHGRNELIVSFIARKTAGIRPRDKPSTIPDWLLDVSCPVPGSPELVVESSSYLLSAQVLAAVDGKRSVRAIAEMVAREYKLSMDECVHAVIAILASAFDSGNNPPNW